MSRRWLLCLLWLAAAMPFGAQGAHAEGLAGLGGASWRLEQPPPPPPPPGGSEAPGPVGLGRIGDIEFWAPNRGVLITAGNGKVVPPGVWAYNGRTWHELSTVCGGTDGRVAWAGPDEFWTIADVRPGQAEVEGLVPRLEDRSLCRFANGRVVESFASPPFQAGSYQRMAAAACLSPEDCWFGGGQLPSEALAVGSFHLHWNGATMTAEPYLGESYAVKDMRAFDGLLFESVKLRPEDAVETPRAVPPAVHFFEPGSPSGQFEPEEVERRHEGILYSLEEEEFPFALNFLHLSATGKALWAAAGAQEEPKSPAPGQVTVVRYVAEGGGRWRQLLGPNTSPQGKAVFPNQTVNAIAAEPGEEGSEGESAWLAMDSEADGHTIEADAEANPRLSASLARIASDGTLAPEDAVTLPSPSDEPGVGPKGSALRITCPAPRDCWMATALGWLFHLAPESERTLAEDTDPAFRGLITERPPDQGVPQIPSDTVPEDNSGILGEITEPTTSRGEEKSQEARVPVALLTKVRTRIVHGTVLELRFHLAVRARLRLIAKRHRRVVAETAMRTLAAGNRKLVLRLDRRRWPTELHLDEHPLAPLPTVGSKGPAAGNTVSTSLVFPSANAKSGLGLLR